MTNEVWIIEAPGKKRYLEETLKLLGRDAFVVFTKGHLYRFPLREKGKKSSPIIDKNFNDFGREPLDSNILHRIREVVKLCPNVMVATDADQEGDVIAWDVASLIRDIAPNPSRIPLKGMDSDSVLEALSAKGPVKRSAAVPGRTRRIIDILIGSAYSNTGIRVGRIGTALLGMVASEQPTTNFMRLSAPSSDGRSPWIAQCPIKSPITESIAKEIVGLSLPVLDPVETLDRTFKPQHMGEIMIEAAETLGLSPSETAKAMQASYEAGKLSYPRSSSKGISRAAAVKMKSILAKAGKRANPDLLDTKTEKDVHDSPHPLGAVNLSLDPTKMSAEEGVRLLIARGIARAGMKHKYQRAKGEIVEKFLLSKGIPIKAAKYVGSLEWTRDLGSTIPGKKRWQKSEVYKRRSDAVLLETALKHNLGKPSTWGTHVEAFLKLGLVNSDLALTERGKEWLSRSPVELLDPEFSARIEEACDYVDQDIFKVRGKTPWQASAERIVKSLPPAITDRIIGAISGIPAKPEPDYREMVDNLPSTLTPDEMELLAERTGPDAIMATSNVQPFLPEFPYDEGTIPDYEISH